jgi:hypothetical protein
MGELQAIEAVDYPGPEFPSAAWLKVALLYWEAISRIVPDGRPPEDPPEVKALVGAGAVRDLSPAPFRRATAESFETRLQDLLQSRPGEPLENGWSRDSKGGEGNPEERVHLTEIEGSLGKANGL